MVSMLSKMVSKTLSLSKSSKFCVLWTYDFVEISPACGANIFQEYMERLYTPTSALAMVARKGLKCKFTAKIDFLIGYITLPLLILTLAVFNFSIHYLISIWTTCWWNFELFDKNGSPFLTKHWHYFGRPFVSWNNCLIVV